MKVSEISSKRASLMLVGATAWFAHFVMSSKFGLYDDDYFRIPYAWMMSWDSLERQLLRFFSFRMGQGRPLHDSLIHFLAYVAGLTSAPLTSAYGLAALIVAANAVTFFLLLRRLVPNSSACLVGGLAFALYPADSTQAFLTHAFGIQPALLLLLISLHLYLDAGLRRAFSYLLMVAVLLCYETFFGIFLVAPLLVQAARTTWVRHMAVLALIFASVSGVRLLNGDGRVANASLTATIATSLFNTVIGPVVNIYSFFYRPLRFAAHLNRFPSPWLAVALLGGLVIGVAFVLLCRYSPKAQNAATPRNVVFAAVLMLLLAYPLTLTTTATSLFGRPSRVHAAAAPGSCLLIACAAGFLIEMNIGPVVRLGFIWAFAVWISLLVGNGLAVQYEYAEAWQYQRQFWTDLSRACLNVKENTTFVIPEKELAWTTELYVFSWDMPLILNQLFEFPASWNSLPRMHMNPDSKVAFQPAKDPVVDLFLGPAPAEFQMLELKRDGDRLVTAAPQLVCSAFVPKNPLYRLMIKSAGEPRVEYLR